MGSLVSAALMFLHRVRTNRAAGATLHGLTLLCAATLLPFALIRLETGPPRPMPEPIKTARPASGARVVVLLIDGLSAHAAFSEGWMPRLQQRIRSGAAHGVAVAPVPTLTPPGVRAIFTGRDLPPRPEIPGSLFVYREHDSVFARAAQAGLSARIIGYEDWATMFEGHGAGFTHLPYRGGLPLANDELTLKEVEAALASREAPDLLAAHFYDLDALGHMDGVDSPRYRERLLWLDGAAARIAAAAGPRAAVLLLADHGQSEDGRHGGGERRQREVPFVLWGAGTRQADLGRFPLASAAPTISALLGIAPPALSDAEPLLDALRLSAPRRSAAVMDWLEQRGRMLGTVDDGPALRARAAGRHEHAESLAKAAVAAAAVAAQRASPRSRSRLLVAGVWLLTAACIFSLAWPAEASAGALAACAAALAALGAGQPAAFCTAALVLLVLSLRPGLGRSAMDWPRWAALWLLLAAAAFPEFADLFGGLLPDLRPRFDAGPAWPWLRAAASALLLFSQRRFLRPLWTCSSLLTGRPRRRAGAWRGLALYAFFLAASTPREAALVGFVTLAGWLLFDAVRFKTALWRGMAAAALALLCYQASGGWMDLSHISVAQAYRTLDGAYSLPALMVLTLLKQAAALTLPLLPLMARRPAAEAVGAGPVFGVLAAGAAASLWMSRFVQELVRTPLGGEPAFERLVWSALAGWLFAGVWVLARARLWPRS